MMKMLMVAEPFGFGPVGSVMSCRRQLASRPIAFRFAGPTFAQDILDEGSFERCTLFERPSHSRLDEDIAWADIVWSATEPETLVRGARAGKRVVYYDPLFWFWPKVPPVYVPGMVYLCQNFPGVTERIRTLAPEVRNCMRVVAPASFSPLETLPSKKPLLLVNLCGLQNPLHPVRGYTELVARCLRVALSGTRWASVLVVGRQEELARVEVHDDRMTCRSVPHGQMLRWMASADFVLSSPGLNSAMEAMGLGVPVAFLPPQNATQARQLEQFAAHELAPAGLDWGSLCGPHRRWSELDETEAIKELSGMVEKCASSRRCEQMLTDRLASLLAMDGPALKRLSNRQASFFASLSGGESAPLAEVLSSEGIG